MCLIYVANLANTIRTIMCVYNKTKSCVRVIRPNFRLIHFDPNDEGSLSLLKNWQPLARLRRVSNQKPTVSKITAMKK
jgi:hypothetical protein